MNRFIDICIFSVLFFSGIVLFKEPFEFYITYIPVVILLPFFIFRYRFPLQLLYLFVPLLLFGMIGILLGDNTVNDFLKIYMNILVSTLFFYYVFEYYDRDIDIIFKKYIRGAIFVSVIGIIQFVSYTVGFKYGYNFRVYGFNKWGYYLGGLGIRVNSILSEPSYYGATLAPAFFVAIYNVVFKRAYFMTFREGLIIIVPYLMTFSTVAYLGIFLALVLLLINYGLIRYIIIVIPVAILLFNIMYNNAIEFKVRVDGLKALYVDNILEKEGLKEGEINFMKVRDLLKKIHGSSFVQYNNYVVSLRNIQEHPFIGTGLGSHKKAFEKYNVLDKLGGIYKFNTSDANSMLLRIMSEMGLVGVLFIFLFIRRYFVQMPPGDSSHYWLISNAALLIILLQLARQGNYTYNGFIFYMWLYYYTFNKSIEEEEATEQQPSATESTTEMINSSGTAPL